MNIDNINIRNANQKDIEQIATIKVSGWQHAYTDIIEKDYLDNMNISEQIDKYTNQYSLNDVFVAELDGKILGFCRVYDYDTPPFDDIDCEIREIYVRPDIKRMGIGSKLFKYTLNLFKEKGKKKLYLGVFENNYKARNFYEKMGGNLNKKSYLEIDGIKYPTVSYFYDLRKK